MSGGVTTDLHGQTDIPFLYACGEVACTGVHGANRLASNSLLEGLVFARRIAAHVEDSIEARPGTRSRHRSYSRRAGRPRVHEDLMRGNLREIMLDSVGMVRSERSLREAQEFLIQNMDVLDTEYLDVDGMELRNMYTLACLINTAALRREESRGCHRRRDFPDVDEWNWRKHIDMSMIDGELELSTRMQPSKPPWELRLPKAQEA
jgi:L-aspartate oxidase